MLERQNNNKNIKKPLEAKPAIKIGPKYGHIDLEGQIQ